MATGEKAIEQTKQWINDVVVGCNFCPFAANVLKQKTAYYAVEGSSEKDTALNTISLELKRLDDDENIETSFIIFPNSFEDFDNYLDLVEEAEELLIEKGYEGVYQLASFHPLYLFEGATEKDAANYTNRSIYPMLHLLRESSIDKALESYKDPEKIPENNIDFARRKGLVYMKMLRDACM